jgi:hypothetical protein
VGYAHASLLVRELEMMLVMGLESRGWIEVLMICGE